MATFLLVLKIIGLTLLGIVALALFILLLVLFVPVRYKAAFKQDDDFRAEAVISYLLHAISLHIVKESDFEVYLKILGIRIRRFEKAKDKPKDKKSDKKIKDSGKTEDKGDEQQADSLEADSEGNAKKDRAEGAYEEPEKSEKKDKDKTDSSKKKKLFDIKSIEKYIDFLNEDSTKNTFRTCCKRLGNLLKIVAPKRFKAEVTYGLEDPSITGKILAIYNILYIYFNKHLLLHPVYDDSIVKSKGYMKGRIFTVSVLIQLILVIADKDCRKFYKEVRNL